MATPKGKGRPRSGPAGPQCRKVLDYMRRHAGRAVSEGELCRGCGVYTGPLAIALLQLHDAGLVDVLDGGKFRLRTT